MMFSQRFSALSRTASRLTTAKRTYPVFDAAVLAYIALVLLVQVLFQISPVVTFLASTPLISIQTWLGLLGAALLAVDVFTSKRVWQGPYCLFLFAILAFAALASVRMIDYGMKENLYKFCWAAIQFGLVYSCAYRTETERLKKYLGILFGVLLVIWLIACCVSLYQFARLIRYDYVVNPMAQDASSNRQGFYDNRLFGIFYTLNHAAYGSLMFFLLGLLYAMRTRHVFVKVLLAVSNLILLCHIVASQSRSAMVALCVCMFSTAFLLARSKLYMKSSHRLTLSALSAVAALVVTVLLLNGIKWGLTYVPPLTSEVFDLPEVAYDAHLFGREMDDGPSNGRFSIWMDYLSLFDEIGPVGLSPGNYMPYVKEHHPDLYIVTHIRDFYGDKFDSGIIYHVHNGYLMVLVSAGWIGASMMLAFALLCVSRLFSKLKDGHKTSRTLLALLLLVVAVSISALFDEGIFFQNNPQTTVFWLALGLLMKECAPAPERDLPQPSV